MIKDYSEIDPVLAEEISDFLLRTTVQIFKHSESGLQPFASGVLFGFEQFHFIITAAHVLRDNMRSDLSVRVGDSLVSLEHEIFHFVSETNNKEKDKVDVGIILIRTQDLQNDFNSNNTYIHLEDLSFNAIQLNSNAIRAVNPDYIMFGYPESQSKLKYGRTDHWKVKALYFNCGLNNVDITDVKESGFTNHLFCNRTSGGLDLYTKQERKLPYLFGMSGCGLWQMDKFDFKFGDIRVKLCGVFYGVEEDLLIFTKVDLAISLIRETFNLKKLPALGVKIDWKQKLRTI